LHTQLINMKIYVVFLLLPSFTPSLWAQPPANQVPAPATQQLSQQPPLQTARQPGQPMTIAQIKTELEKSPNPLLYTKEILKKRFKIDTITVTRTKSFKSLADSLAYNGKERRVYGPYGPKGARFLVQVLNKAPNLFYHIGQIFIDTSVFRFHVADSIGNKIMDELKNGSASFESLAQTYSMGGEGSTKGDLGWIARGALLTQIEHEVSIRKKGEVFKIWSPNGMHIIRKMDDARQDTGFALMMRVFL
jgi:hypothetical protein